MTVPGEKDDTDLRPLDIAGARILIVNDDGIEARGLKELERLAATFGGEVWTVAPADGRSAASAQVSINREIQIVELVERRYAVTGSPADSTIAALQVVMRDNPPDLVLSGINHGSNLGEDIHFSGTVGAASAAAAAGIPAIALSLGGHTDFSNPAAFDNVHRRGAEIVTRLCGHGFKPGLVYNVNFPTRLKAPDGPALFRPHAPARGTTFRLKRRDDRDSNHYRVSHHEDRPTAEVPDDYTGVLDGHIVVTPLSLDRSEYHVLNTLGEAV